MQQTDKMGQNSHTPPNQMANILIVDNDQESIRSILEILARRGIAGHLAFDRKTAIGLLEKNRYEIIFVAENISENSATQTLTEGLRLVNDIIANHPEIPIIFIAQNNSDTLVSVATAVKTIQAGCRDYLLKPLNKDKIEHLLDTFVPNHNISMVESAQQDSMCLYQIVGKSQKLTHCIELAKRVAPTTASVLINGESGTGKELISYLIHHNSRRTLGPYIRINCAALNDNLLESELFGHEKGAFTGAILQRKGRFEMAHGGTLLLDEISETPLNFQAKLLRVLEQQDFERVGGSENIRVNVRIISTTNKDLLTLVQQGKFREDLYYRLSAVRLILPPLRERPEDLHDLVWHFVNIYAKQTQRKITHLDSAMIDIFAKYRWPGNIRQLKNVVLMSLALGTGPALSLADVSWLFDEIQVLPLNRNSQNHTTSGSSAHGFGGVPLAMVERKAILETLRQTDGNQTKAAKVLGISDRTLRDKIKQYRQVENLQPI